MELEAAVASEREEMAAQQACLERSLDARSRLEQRAAASSRFQRAQSWCAL